MLTKLIEKLKADRKTIVFPEGTDYRILEAAARLMKEELLDVILVGVPEEVQAKADELGHDISKATIINPATYEGMDALVEQMVELRKGKMTAEQCKEALLGGAYFGTMLVKAGIADALLGGATYTTADTVRPALQLIKTKPGSKKISSCYIMVKEGCPMLCMGDPAINIEPTAEELAEAAVEYARTAEIFGIDPRVAMLSYSTFGSGAGAGVDKVREATKLAKAAAPQYKIDGEMQFDAAVNPVVAAQKCKGSEVAGQANTFVFPGIEAANIGYKILQHLGGYAAYGPIMQGLNAPINDLSRGCNAEEVYTMSIITVALAD